MGNAYIKGTTPNSTENGSKVRIWKVSLEQMGRLRASEKPKLSKTCHVRLGQVPIAPPSFSTILFLNFVYKLFLWSIHIDRWEWIWLYAYWHALSSALYDKTNLWHLIWLVWAFTEIFKSWINPKVGWALLPCVNYYVRMTQGACRQHR